MVRSFIHMGFLIQLMILTGAVPVSGSDSVEAFGPGEKLHFVLKWAGITAGDAFMNVEESEDFDGEIIYKIVSTAKSRSAIDAIYKVRNRYESHIDPENGLPMKYVMHSREGGRTKDRVILFDQENNVVQKMEKRKDGTISSEVFEILDTTYDTISSLYAMRDREVKIGESLPLNVFDNHKNYELVIDILQEEQITVSAGQFNTIKVQPKLKSEGVFRRKGELFVWVTNDERHIPVLMKSKVKVGSFTAELVHYTDGHGLVYGEEVND
jgi:hypothetical protein